jgi:hypothetical protein
MHGPRTAGGGARGRRGGSRPSQMSASSPRRELFAGVLSAAKANRDRLERLDLNRAGLDVDDWLSIVGTGQKTRVRLLIRSRRGNPYFDLRSADRENLWTAEEARKRVLTGDGTVPYLGARCSFVPTEKVVCVTPQHLGYWEVADRLLQPAAGFHGLLPRLNLVQRLVVAHLAGRSGRDLRARPAPGVRTSDWDPPVPGGRASACRSPRWVALRRRPVRRARGRAPLPTARRNAAEPWGSRPRGETSERLGDHRARGRASIPVAVPPWLRPEGLLLARRRTSRVRPLPRLGLEIAPVHE